MPYIHKNDRQHIEHKLEYADNYGDNEVTIERIAEILSTVPSGKRKGAFNYFVCRLFMNTFGINNEQSGYTDISDALAVFGDMEHEIRRRVLDKYEDKVIIKNGDVPEFIAYDMVR